MKRVFGFIVAAALVALCVYCYIVANVRTTYDLERPIACSFTDEEGETDIILFSPKFNMIVLKEYKDIAEFGKYEMCILKAGHYFGSLYCVGKFPFGLRICKNAELVAEVNTKLVYCEGDSFPKIGSMHEIKVIVYADCVVVNGDKYERWSDEKTDEFNQYVLKLMKEYGIDHR